MPRTFIQRSVYLSREQNEEVNGYLSMKEFLTFSGLMKQLLLAHIRHDQEARCVTAAPTSIIQ